jgi:hypothetical protein
VLLQTQSLNLWTKVVYLFIYLFIYLSVYLFIDLLCGLVVRVLDYSSRGPVQFSALPDFLSSGSGTGSTIEELLERKSSDSGLENREYGRRDQLL